MLHVLARFLGPVLAGPCLLLAVNVVAQTGMPQDLEAQLIERVEARWEALEARDFGRAYTLMSPAYRSVFTEEMYLQQPAPTLERELTSVEILNYDAAAAVASVAVGVMSRPVKQTSAAAAAIQARPVRVIEQWILRNNSWWFSVIK